MISKPFYTYYDLLISCYTRKLSKNYVSCQTVMISTKMFLLCILFLD
ncbi:hypothetical protein THOM_1172 [Trachipleistophora hominis]|uniref:Uncharacterized protein n=1 Tax=Trachipleistophora hominis TaxID=72359 RepID=L7JYP4_TRAHO|nr:hypothetical protein THOM_1172 [Trachipleistophora hominis]